MNDLFTSSAPTIVSSNRILYTASAFARTALLHLQEIGELTALQPHKSSRSELSSYLFFTVVSGSGTLTYQNKSYTMNVGDCVYIDCNGSYSHSTGDDLWSIKWCHFYGSVLPAVYEKYCERGGRPVFHPSSQLTIDEICDVWEELFVTAKSDNYMRDMLINQYLSKLLTLIMSESWHPEDQESLPTKRSMIIPVKEYLDANYGDKITLDALSERFFINKYYLTKSFKEQYGISINSYLLNTRITQAKQLLRFSDESIEGIGLKCGLGSPQYFSSKFKEVEGVSPRMYREQW